MALSFFDDCVLHYIRGYEVGNLGKQSAAYANLFFAIHQKQ